jgi:hypothetical protein
LRVNGSVATARGFWNFLNTVDGIWATVDDAGANESELRFTPSGAFYSDNSVGSFQTRFVSFDDSADLTAVVTDNTGGSGFVNITFTLKTDSVSNTELANMAANTIKANPTASAADPQDFAISANNFPARVGGNLVSHPFSTLAGAGLGYDGAGTIDIGADAASHLVTTASEIRFSKSRRRNFWFEDFSHIPFGRTAAGITTAGLAFTCGASTWHLQGQVAGAEVITVAPIANHPGIVRIGTGTTSGNGVIMYQGVGDTGGVLSTFTLANQILMAEAILRVPTVTSILWEFGFKDNAGDNFIEFYGDTSVGTTIHSYTEEAAVSTDNDTGTVFAANAWNVYTILQETAGIVDFYIDDVLETTHNTNVPDNEGVCAFFRCVTRTGATRQLDIDYVAFESTDLGARTS